MSTIYYLTRIEFGEGQAPGCPEFLAALGIRKPRIATDKGLVATGLVGRSRLRTRHRRHLRRHAARTHRRGG